jgi:preprotein translocase subunit SecE
VARDRQRAKQRKQKRGDGTPPGDTRPIHRENVPGPVEHTGDVDQFEAELVAGAEGEPYDGDGDGVANTEADDNELARQALGGRDEPVATGSAVPATTGEGSSAPARGSGPARFMNFLRASWAELQRVQWPDRRQVGQATAVVLGFVVVAGAFLGLADVVAERIVDVIL